MFRGKSWFSGGMWKPKNLHSLEHLKYLYNVLSKNETISEQNKGLLVETLRSIAEILIWGDQNDSTVFDFFLEKNMLSFFLKIMNQKCGRYVCVQLLQTLNILFENIRNETSLYYLLSNNHVNSIIVHKFDFSDEEVMAYYISFLKTLSLKLNTHTIHFFYNEHTNDFPLYTEAIKFFMHSESMVRIAVRTLTLNVFKVQDKAMLKFIRDNSAAPYFSNLVHFIGKHVLELDSCVKANSDFQIQTKLSDLVAEHLDHLHYLNDILCLQIDALNDVLTDHLLNKLLVPLYVYSLTHCQCAAVTEEERRHVSTVISLFLLSQVFLIISHQPLVKQLAHIILNGNLSVFSKTCRNGASSSGETRHELEFSTSEVASEKSSDTTVKPPGSVPLTSRDSIGETSASDTERVGGADVQSGTCATDVSLQYASESVPFETKKESSGSGEDVQTSAVLCAIDGANITDEEKAVASQKLMQFDHMQQNFSLTDRPFLEAVFSALDCTENDHAALFALCLLYALGHNPGINQDLLDTVLMPSDKSETKVWYNVNLIERMLKIIGLSCQYDSKVRLATLQMNILLLKQLVVKDVQSFLQDRHLAAIEQYREESTSLLRNFYKSEIFLDMFEDEYEEMKKKPLNVEYLMMDANLLLPPTGTPMSGVEFHKRLPCGEDERARRAIRVFFLLRDLSLTLQNEPETQLPLTDISSCTKVNDVLDLTNSDLIFCTVITKDGQKIKRFMVIDNLLLILVEPDPKRHGWGVAKFVGFLQDIEVAGDKEDNRCLHITVRPSGIASGGSRSPLLTARFIVDDHIRCMAAKQRLTKGRKKARETKMYHIARLLDLPGHIQPCPSPLRRTLHVTSDASHSSVMPRSQSQDTGLRGKSATPSTGRQYMHRPLFTPVNKVPGYATMLKHDEAKHSHVATDLSDKSGTPSERRRTSSSPVLSRRQSPRSRESSPRQRSSSSSEEIPLEDLSKSRGSRHSSPSIRRRSASGLPQARISAPPGMYHLHHLCPTTHARSVATTTDLREIEKDRTSHVVPSSSEEIFQDVEAKPSPKTLRPADTPPVSLVLDSEQKEDTLMGSPLILPPANSVPSTSSSYTKEEQSESPPEKICVKPCCAMERSHEKLEFGPANTCSENSCQQSDSTGCVLTVKHEKVRRSNAVNPAVECSNIEVHDTTVQDSGTSDNITSSLDKQPLSSTSSSSGTKVKGAIQTV